jgi:general secretion pathway protein G
MEVLLVLVILVVLSAMAFQMFGGTRQQALIDSTTAKIGMLKHQIDLYEIQINQYPSTLNDLLTRPADAAASRRWQRPFIEASGLVDAWENEINYVIPGKNNPDTFDLWSNGPDGQSGTEDDIGNWVSQ